MSVSSMNTNWLCRDNLIKHVRCFWIHDRVIRPLLANPIVTLTILYIIFVQRPTCWSIIIVSKKKINKKCTRSIEFTMSKDHILVLSELIYFEFIYYHTCIFNCLKKICITHFKFLHKNIYFIIVILKIQHYYKSVWFLVNSIVL